MATGWVLTGCDYSGFRDVEDLLCFFFITTLELGATRLQEVKGIFNALLINFVPSVDA